MITVVSAVRLASPICAEDIVDYYSGQSNITKHQPGLMMSLHYCSDDGLTSGRIYIWSSRAAAEAYYTSAWYERVEAWLGCRPSLTWYQSPIFIDNRNGEILTGCQEAALAS